MRLLGSHRVLTSELAGQMRRAVGLRNVLVHDYLDVDVDDDIVVARLGDPSDLDAFVATVVEWLRSVGNARENG